LIAGAVAKRYARALADVAVASHELEAVRDDLRAFARLLAEQRELRQFVANPSIARRAAVGAVTDILTALGLRPLAVRFLTLLLEAGRLGRFDPILQSYEQEVSLRLGRVQAVVTSAAPLPEAEQEALRRRLSAVTGIQIHLDMHTDPALLGGLVAQVGSRMFDGSLRTQLRRMREALAR
jgi:F-type H+-transporting ATPase subunit delta